MLLVSEEESALRLRYYPLVRNQQVEGSTPFVSITQESP
jgi:hypothetical protein